MPEQTETRTLLHYTELRDIRTVEIRGFGADDTVDFSTETQRIDISLELGSIGYKATIGELRVRTKVKAEYSLITVEGVKDDPFGGIDVVFELVLNLSDEIAPESVTEREVQLLESENLNFMLFPYVRSALQSLAAELRLPPTIIPFLRRDA